MIITTEGIVLRQRKIANNRRMIVLFTKQYGKISAGTSINEKSRGKAALALRPFTYADYDIFKGREAYSINSASVRKSFYSIGEDIDRFMMASSFIEYLDKVLGEGEPVPRLFDLSLQFLESVSRSSRNAETLLYAFIFKSLAMLGVSPETECCVNCGKPASEFGRSIGRGAGVSGGGAGAAGGGDAAAGAGVSGGGADVAAREASGRPPAPKSADSAGASGGGDAAAGAGVSGGGADAAARETGGRPPAPKSADSADAGRAFRLFSVSSGGIICEDCAEEEKRGGNSLLYSPSFDIIDVFRYFGSKPLRTFEKAGLRPDAAAEIREILAEYIDRYLGADVLKTSIGLEV